MKTKMILKKIVVLVGMLTVLMSINGIGYCVVLEDGKDKTKLPIIEERGGLVRPDEIKKQEPQYAPGEIIVKLKEPTTSQEVLAAKPYSVRKESQEDILSNLKSKYNLRDEKPVFEGLHNKLKARNLSLQQLNAQEETKSPQQATKKPQGAKQPDLLPIYIFKTDKDVLETCEKLKADPDVEYAEPNYVVKIQMVPNDPFYHSSGSWGQPYDDLWGIKKIQCEQAWDISQGEGVVVAVIDTGVDYNHEDLVQNIWVNPGEDLNHNGVVDASDLNGIDDDNNGYVDDIRGWDFATYGGGGNDNNPIDGHGHGTHVSGTIAGIGNNNLGVIGVAPKAKIMAIKGLSDAGSGYTSDLVNCVIYAADNGAQVLSNSWGGIGTSQVLTDAFNYAYNKGCISVAAAGNSNMDVSDFYPANIDTVIAVAASNQNDEKCDFSNYGEKVAVAAPGYDILSLYPNNLLLKQSKAIVNVTADNNKKVAANIFEFSVPIPINGMSGEILCANLGRPEDFVGQDFNGKLAFMVRGEIYFRDKVFNAHQAGAIGAIIYNNKNGNFNGTLESQSGIPAVSLSMEDGEYLKNLVSFSTTIVTITPVELGYYQVLSGTSMACPHVAGLAALLLSKNPNSTSEEVRSIIKNASDDIIHTGEDALSRYGIINATRALIPSISISQPARYSFVHGRVDIVGSAFIEGFTKYELYYSTKDDPQNLIFISSSTAPVQDGSLGIWDTIDCPEGINFLTLKVIRNDSAELKVTKAIIVNNINTPPVLKELNDKISYIDRVLTFKVEADDPDDPATPAGYLTYSADNLPSGASFDRNTGIFSWSRPASDKYYRNVIFTVSDSSNSVSKEIRLIPAKLTYISAGEGLDPHLDIYEDKIVWSRNNGPDLDIYMYNLSTRSGKWITNDEIDLQVSPAIYGNKIVWADPRNTTPGVWNDDWNIYMYDLSTGLERQITENEKTQVSPNIFGDKIIWEDWRNEVEGPIHRRDLYMYDLATQQETQITTDQDGWDFRLTPIIYGEKIVWWGMDRNTRIYYIFVYDTSNNQTTRIATDSKEAYWPELNPDLYEDKIVWTESLKTGTDIYMYNLSTHEKTCITTNPKAAPYLPAIYGDKIVWIDDRNINMDEWPDYTREIYMYDLSTQQEILIIGAKGLFYDGPAIYGNKIAWVEYDDSGNGMSKIGIAELIQGTSMSLPIAPSNLTAQALSSTQLKLTWQDNSSDEKGFKIALSTDGRTFTYKGAVGIDKTTYTIGGLTANTSYYFRVYAYNVVGNSYSAIIQGTTMPLPIAPSNITAQALSSTQLKLTWQDNSLDETGFRVEISSDGATFAVKGSALANITTCTISGLTANTTYHFRAYSIRGNDKSVYSETIQGTTMPLPVAPSNLTTQALSSTQIKLFWQDNSADETGFRVELSPDGTTFAVKGSAAANITTCTISGLTANTTYHFRAYAVRGADKSVYSEVVQGTTMPLPIAPSNLSTQALSSTQIKLTWQDNSSDETGFRVEVSTDGVTYVYKAGANANGTTCTISYLTIGTTYYFRVYAIRGNDKSPYSDVITATVMSLPVAPSNLTATAISSTQIKLNWQDNSTDEMGFKIEQSPDGITFTYKGYVTADKTTYTASGLTSGKTYYYRAYAYRGYDKSTYSNVASGTTQ